LGLIKSPNIVRGIALQYCYLEKRHSLFSDSMNVPSRMSNLIGGMTESLQERVTISAHKQGAYRFREGPVVSHVRLSVDVVVMLLHYC
jgi:hypothetical protein